MSQSLSNTQLVQLADQFGTPLYVYHAEKIKEQYETHAPILDQPAAALLKDMNGQIVIDVPMSGNIDDPSLRIGKVVVRVIVNLLTKAAVSPVALQVSRRCWATPSRR